MWWEMFVPFWRRRRRRRRIVREAIERARAEQDAEHQAAKRRIIESNTWNAPT